MKKKNSYETLKTKNHAKVRSIPKSILRKLLMLLGGIIPIAALIAYTMRVNFFSITEILSIFMLIISIAGYLKDEVIYSNPKATYHDDKLVSRKNVAHKKYNKNFYLSLKNGTLQVVLSMLIIILCTYLGQVIYKAIA